MNLIHSKLQFMLFAVLAFLGMNVMANEVVDVLTQAKLAVSTTSTYATFSGFADASNAVYAGQCAGDKSSIQLRSSNSNSGIVTTASGGTARKVTVEWNAGTTADRTLNVYGSNTAYTQATDLYDTSTQGKLLGTIDNGVSTELEIEGDYAYIGFRSKSGAMYLTSVSITWEAEGVVAKPVISGTTPFFGSTQVEITCVSPTASIYYTLDGSEPTNESTLYSAPFDVTATTTVKAVAIEAEGSSSAVATKTFTALPTVADIAAMNALNNDDAFAFAGEVTVIYASGSYVYVKDATGYSLIYKNDTGLEKGQVIVAGWQGVVKIFKNLFEAIPSSDLETKDETVEVTYENGSIADVTADNMNKIIVLKDVNYTIPNGKNFTISYGETSVVGYNQFGLDINEPADDTTYDITGVISVFNETVQFQPISIVEHAVVLAEKYLANPSFELSDADQPLTEEKAASNGTLDIYGWTMDGVGTQYNNTELRAAGSTSTTSQFGTSAPSDGNYSLFFRQGWNNAGNTITLTSNFLEELPAGSYILSVDYKQYYSYDNTQNANTKVGIACIGNDGTVLGEAISPAAAGVSGGSNGATYFNEAAWSTLEAAFTIEEPVAGAVKVTLYSAGQRRSDFFIDHIRLEKISDTDVARAALAAAIATATELSSEPAGQLFQKSADDAEALAAAIDEATAVEADETATATMLQAATTALQEAIDAYNNAALILPAAGQAYSFELKDTELFMSLNDGIKLSAQPTALYFEQMQTGYALCDGKGNYVAFTGTGNNTWSMSASTTAYEWIFEALPEGFYAIAKAANTNEHIGVDNATDGGSCYANKAVNDNSRWTIAEMEVVEPEVLDVTDLIANPAYLVDGYSGWTYSENGFKARSYEAPMNLITYSGNADFTVSQTIANVPAGLYKLTVNAFYRAGSLDAEKALVEAGAELPKNLTMYATVGDDTYSQQVMNLSEGGTPEAYGGGTTMIGNSYVPNSAAESRDWYIAGAYTNEVLFNVFEDGAVTIGLNKTPSLESDYCPIGAWKLYRLGDADETQATPDEQPEQPSVLQPGDDATAYIVNPSFETGDLTGWTVGSSSDTGVKPNSNGTYTTDGCDGDYLFNTWWQGIPITQTIQGLPNGLYELKALMTNDAITAGNKACLYLTANGNHSAAFYSSAANVFAEGSMQFYVTDGTATIGAIGGNADGTYREDGYYWYKADNFRLTYIAKLPDISEIEIPEGKMSNAAAEAIAAAQQAQDVVALIEAAKAAEASIAAYAEAAKAIETAKAIKDATNVTTEDATATFAEAIAAIENAYDEGSMDDATAKAAGLTLGTVITGWRAGADGAAVKFMESAYNLNGFDSYLYINTWSAEGETDGSEFKVPFYEYFTGDDDTLAPQTITTTVTGLTPGYYTVKALIRVQLTNGQNAPTGVTLSANGGTAVDATADATLYDESKLYLKEVTAMGNVGEDGTLAINIDVLEDNSIHWLSFKNVSYTAISEDEFYYQNALSSIKDGMSYHVFTTVNDVKYYLNATGYLVTDVNKAGTFTFNAVQVDGTRYETGWDLGCKFTNPALTNGASGDIVKNGHINVGSSSRNDWERQVFFQNEKGKFAVRATNANSDNWGANTYWCVDNLDAELPTADYALSASFVWEIEENIDNRPDAFAKVQTWAVKLQTIEGLMKDASMYTSNAKESREGSYAELLDNDYTSFFHSSWSAAVEDDHYLQAELPDAAQEFFFYFKKRSQNNNNRPTNIVISGSNDGVNFTDITTISEGLPTDAAVIDYISGRVDANEAYKFIRFTVMDTNNHAKEGNGHVFFTFSEFYILPADGLTAEAAQYMVNDYTDLSNDDVEAIYAVDKKISAALTQIELAESLVALKAMADRFIAQLDATDTYEADANYVADLKQQMEGIKAAVYSSQEEVDNATATIIATAKKFFATATAKATIDITEWFIVNAEPMTKDGWEGTDFGDASSGVCEYWNKSAAEFHQTITELPAGYFKLSVVAMQRTGMTGYVYAGDEQCTIAQAANTEANSRSEAAQWFAAGNGVNEVVFSTEQLGEMTIGLQADGATGDHWTVWKNFKLEIINADEYEEAKIDGAREALLAAIQKAEAAVAQIPADKDYLFMPSVAFRNALSQETEGAQAVYDNEESSLANVLAATTALNEKMAEAQNNVNLPDADKKYSLQLKDGGMYLALTSETTPEEVDELGNVVNEATTTTRVYLSETPSNLSWIATESGEYYLTDGELYVGIAGTNAWSMSADADKKALVTVAASLQSDVVYYTLKTANGLIGADNTEAGNNLFCNKTQSDKSLWTIAEIEDMAITFALTPTIESGVQTAAGSSEGFNKVRYDAPFTLNVTAENLQANGYNPDELTIKIGTVFAAYFNSPGWTMGADTSKLITAQNVEIPFAETITLDDVVFDKDFPFVQGITLAGISLVKGDEVIATMEGLIVVSYLELVDEDGNPVGIDSISVAGQNGTIYDLAGRKVEKLQKGGIYVINGKKVVVK